MRTIFHDLEDDHELIHADLAVEYNRTTAIDFSKLGHPIALDARDYGLADGATSDGQALFDAFQAASALIQWGDRSIAGVRLTLPPGVFTPTVQYGNPAAAIKRLPLPAPSSSGGFIIVEGSSAGGTVLQAPNAGTGAGKTTVTAVTTRSTNVYTVTAAAHGLAVGDPIVFPLTTRANTKNFVSTTVLAVTDANTFTYIMGDTTAANLDTLKVANGATIDKLDYLIEPTGFRQQQLLYFRSIAFNGPASNAGTLNNVRIGDPNNLPNPQIGYAVRKTSRVHFEHCLFQGWWAGEVICGAARGTPGQQNTDHNSSSRCQYINNVDAVIFLDNQRQTGGPAVGGSRDHTWRDCNWGVTARSMIAVNDGGAAKGVHIAVGHNKSTSIPVFIEGVDGVLPSNQPKLSLWSGDWKNESAGTAAIAWDESRLSTWDQSNMNLRSEVMIAVNGGTGNQNTASLTPWTVTTSITSAVQTVVLPAGHGIRVGDHLCVGSGINVGNNYVPGAADGASIVKTVSTNTVTMDRPDYTGADIASYTATAGLICGWRMGYADNVHLTWQLGVSSSGNQMARSAAWWNFAQEPNCLTVNYLTNEGSGSGNVGTLLPSFTIESGITAGWANRTVVHRGDQRFLLLLHDGGGNAIPKGGVVEYTGQGQVLPSTGVKTRLFAGIAMQASPASGATAATNNGLTGATALVRAERPYMMVAAPGTALPLHDSPIGGLVTTAGSPPTGVSATVASGDVIVDAKDGMLGTWNGSTTGLRKIGQALANMAGGTVAMLTCPEIWT